jgi:hypothetical protein
VSDIRLSMTLYRPGHVELDIHVSVEHEDGYVAYATGPSSGDPVRFWWSGVSNGWEMFDGAHWKSATPTSREVLAVSAPLRDALMRAAKAGLVAVGASRARSR